jgi:hypothetical protein
MMMDRVLLIGGAMVAVGIVLAAAFLFVARYGATFEMLEDAVVRWLGKAWGGWVRADGLMDRFADRWWAESFSCRLYIFIFRRQIRLGGAGIGTVLKGIFLIGPASRPVR